MWWLLWTFAILATSFFIFVVVFIVVSFVDLENDDLQPRDLTQKANQFVLPEYLGQAFLTLLFLLTGYYLEFFANLLLVLFHARRYHLGTHLYDPTKVFDVKESEKRVGLIKLGFYMIAFCFYIYRLIFAIVVSMKPASRFAADTWL